MCARVENDVRKRRLHVTPWKQPISLSSFACPGPSAEVGQRRHGSFQETLAPATKMLARQRMMMMLRRLEALETLWKAHTFSFFDRRQPFAASTAVILLPLAVQAWQELLLLHPA